MLTDIKDRRPNQQLIDYLESLLESAKKGEIRTHVGVSLWADDTCTHGWEVDRRNSMRKLLGEMSILHFDLLTAVAIHDGDTILAKNL